MRLVWLCFALVVSMSSSLAAAPILERVVMVSRHGIRSPLRSVAILQALSKRGWPAWPVGPGEMTEHGAKNLALMADFLRSTYAAKGALPERGCPTRSALQIWADVADNRTRESGRILAERLAPGCRVAASHALEGTIDSLFDATRSNICPVGLFAAGRALIAATREKDGLLRPEDRHALEALQAILAPAACEAGGAGVCLVPKPGAAGVTAAAQLALGAMVAEGIYLEYVQGFPAADVGWGKAATPQAITSIIPAHERGIDLRRRTSVLAARRGVVLARTVLALLQNRPLPPGAPALPDDAKLVMIAGHDSNLLYLASLMGLAWELPNQPSVTAPDTTLAFEVWRDPATAEQTLKIVVYAQTLGQLRDASVLDAAHPPDVVAVAPDACAQTGGTCLLKTFADQVTQSLDSLCGG